MEEAARRAIANNLILQQATQQAIASSLSARPKNTIKNYKNKQEEFIKWCEIEMRFVDGSLVTEEKVIAFLQHVVIPRGSRKQTNDEVIPLSAEGLEGYAKALVDLYSMQQALTKTGIPHPRGRALKEFLRTHKRERAKRKREQYCDRGAGTVQDTYTTEELRKVATHFFALSNGQGLRDRLDLLLGHAIMARGESTRKIQLPDLFSMQLAHEGPTQCVAAMVIIDQGKTNQFGRIEYGGCIRHKNVELCPIGALAIYLFWRFHIAGETFPDFSSRQKWYDTFLIDGKTSTKEISYSSQARSLKKAMKACGIVSAKVTHIRRTSSCVIAEAGGASDASIRRGGRWNNEKMEGCYLTTLPKEVVRALAGFNAAGGEFFLPRAELTVPDEILKQVFPSVEETLFNLTTGDINDIAGQGFLRLMQHLRVVLIQDSVILQRAYPQHPVWRHSVFQSQQYTAFSNSLLERLAQLSQEKVHVSVKAAVPVLSNVIESGLASVNMRLNSIDANMVQMRSDLQAMGRRKFTIVMEEDVGDRTKSVTGQSFSMSRKLRSVVEVWQEYNDGLNGMPSIRSLEQSQGTKWRSSDSERKYFSRRKVFYDAIEFLAVQQNLPHATVANMLEVRRVEEKKSLDGFMRMLKEKGCSYIM